MLFSISCPKFTKLDPFGVRLGAIGEICVNLRLARWDDRIVLGEIWDEEWSDATFQL